MASLKKITFFFVFIYSTSYLIQAQSLTIGADPFGLAVSGYEIELGVNFGKNRISASISQIAPPSMYYPQNDKFEIKRSYFDVFYARFLNEEQRGFNYGVSFGYFYDEEVTRKDTTLVQSKDYFRAGIKLGYYWYPFKNKENALKGFFIEPAFNIGFALNDYDVEFPDETFKASLMKVSGPIFHFGYKFDLSSK